MAKARHNRAPTSRMQLKVKNFGPIIDGRIDLRPLTVLAGPSNTGKSWLATLVYVMEQHRRMENFSSISFGNYQRPFYQRPLFEVFEVAEKSNIKKERFPENPEQWIKSLKKSGQVKLTAPEIKTIRRVMKSLANRIEKELLRCYGTSQASDLVLESCKRKKQPRDRQAELSVLLGQVNHRLNLNIEADKVFSLNVDIPKTIVLDTKKKDSRYLDVLATCLNRINISRDPRNSYDSMALDIYNVIGAVTEGLLSSQAGGKVHYLPAGRGGVMRTRSVVVGALIRNASRTSLRSKSTQPLLTGVLGDFLEQIHIIIEHAARQKIRERSRHDLGINLEDEILQGAVEVVPGEAGVPQIFYRPKGWKRPLPLTNVSSMVSELAPVVLYLRYSVSPGDLLIIEEPETNLHPAMQREFTHQIALLVQSGVQVLLTTHSEWVLEEIANIVARGEAKKDNGSDVAGLAKEDVGVWLFEPADKNKSMAGSKIKEVSWEPDDGGYATGLDEVAMDIHNEWADAMNQTS